MAAPMARRRAPLPEQALREARQLGEARQRLRHPMLLVQRLASELPAPAAAGHGSARRRSRLFLSAGGVGWTALLLMQTRCSPLLLFRAAHPLRGIGWAPRGML